jgi:hypothetical protein
MLDPFSTADPRRARFGAGYVQTQFAQQPGKDGLIVQFDGHGRVWLNLLEFVDEYQAVFIEKPPRLFDSIEALASHSQKFKVMGFQVKIGCDFLPKTLANFA